ncbi:hypothetical protein H8B17_20470 [Sphingobacterium arenae]|uniref:Uncharacterized protein n=1 Tax=Sphingobacterium arenae TaxID=1280598 RepID=A0ABR7Y9J7_9SPHI|nr:hypothetical protein [Sphingobacterium arenae]
MIDIFRDTKEKQQKRTQEISGAESFGLLVPLSCDVSIFTPAAYRRGSLPRPCKEA